MLHEELRATLEDIERYVALDVVTRACPLI